MNVKRSDDYKVRDRTKSVQRAAMCNEISLQKTLNVSVVATEAVETAALSRMM